MENQKATQEEISKIQEMNSKFNQAKLAIADCELQKESILKHIEGLKLDFSKYENDLVEKYGADSIINIQTGMVTKNKD